MVDPCCKPNDDELENLKDRAKYANEGGRLDRSSAIDAKQANQQCSTHHISAGWANGSPLIQPLGGTPYPTRGQYITNASVTRGSPIQTLGCGLRLGQMSRRSTSIEENPRSPIAELAYVFIEDVSGGSQGFDIQRCYIGGICPFQLVFEQSRTRPIAFDNIRTDAFHSAMALDERGAILEVRKGRLYPFGTGQVDDPFPADYAAQLNNPNSDYWRYPNKQAFLIDRGGNVTEIETGSNEHIGTWDYNQRGFNFHNRNFNGVEFTSFCLESEFLPGSRGGVVQGSNAINRSNGNITVVRPTEPTIGSNLLFSDLQDLGIRNFMLFGIELERQVWLCNVQVTNSLTECSGVIQSAVPITLKRLVGNERLPFIGVAESGVYFQPSGRYLP